MAISVRLDPQMKASLALAAKRAGISQSEFVRRAVIERLEKESINSQEGSTDNELDRKHDRKNPDTSQANENS